MKEKTIDLDETTHEKLKYLKKEDETMNDLIERLRKEKMANYSDFNGILSRDTTESIKK